MKTALRVAATALFLLACASASASAISVQVNDSEGNPLADAVVYAQSESGEAGPMVAKGATIEQRGSTFLPLVSVIQTGSKVTFPNYDKVRHHIYSFSPVKKFDQKLYSGVAAAPQVFDKAGTVVLGCNIHDRMIAYVKVVDTPFFARTDAAGVARIDVPAAGKYKVSAWHFNLAGASAEQALAVKAGDAPSALAFRLALKPAAPAPDAAGSGAY